MKCECCKSDLGKRIVLNSQVGAKIGRLWFTLSGDFTRTHHKILKDLYLDYHGKYNYETHKHSGKKFYEMGMGGAIPIEEFKRVNEMIYRVWTKFPQLGIPVHVEIQYDWEKPIKKVLTK